MKLPKSWTFHWVVCRALSTSTSIAEKRKHSGYKSTFMFITKLVVQGSLIHLPHYNEQEEQFLQYTVTQDETWVHCTTPETKKSIHDVETPITSHSKGIQRNAISKEEHSNTLLGAQRHTSCEFP